MTFATPKEARETWPCPTARTFAKKIGDYCDAEKCPVWRWLPIQANDPRFSSAVKKEITRLAKEKGSANKAGFHAAAVKNVTEDPKAHGVPDAPEQGWCGLGGKPEV